MPKAISYLGMTASTGEQTNDNQLTNWVVQKVISTPTSFKIFLDSSDPISAGDYINLNIFMYDRCNNRYVPSFDTGLDSENFLSLYNFNNTCTLMSVSRGLSYRFFEKGPAFKAVVSCMLVGTKEIKLNYKGDSIEDYITVDIQAGALWAAEVTFPNGAMGSIDGPFLFNVKPLDRGKNIAATSSEELKKLISFEYPNPGYSTMEITVNNNSNGTYSYLLSCQFSGPYTTSSKLFIFSAGFQYDFYIATGAPDMQKSIAIILDSNMRTMDGITFISAGTKAYLQVHFYDKNGNTVDEISLSNYRLFLSVLGLNTEITSVHIYDVSKKVYNTAFTFTKKGPNQLNPKYLGKDLNCPYCQFQVKAGNSLFEKSDLLISDDNSTIKYSVNPNGNNYSIIKPYKISFLLVLKDIYGNDIDNVNSNNYTAILSGNYMKNIQLSLSDYSIGSQVTVPEASIDYFQSLVGRIGYSINITELSTSKVRSFALTIISDGSDNDADNGDYIYYFTTFSWINGPVDNKFVTAGLRYKLAIQLNTVTGRRYNQWIDESLVNFTFTSFYPAKGEVIYAAQKGSKRGVYTVEFMVIVGRGLIRSGAIYIDGKKAIKRPIFMSIGAEPAILSIDKANLKSEDSLLDGVVLNSYQFICHLTDVFSNPVNVKSTTDFNLIVKSEKASYMPSCTVQTIGDYSCEFSPEAFGEYNISSAFFTYPYKLSVIHGDPSILNTNAGILNDLSTKLLAGETILFKITPKDPSGGILTQAETIADLDKFSLILKNPDNQLKSIALEASSVDSNGEIRVKALVTLSGRYSFQPLLNGQGILCEICAFEVNYNSLDSQKTKVFLLVNEDRKEILPSQTLQIDNTKIIPLFYMQFYDQYLNQRPVSSDLTGFKAVLTVPGSSEQTYVFLGSELRGDYQFILPGERYSSFQFELANERCDLQFTAISSLGSNIRANFSNVILAGSSNDSSFTNDLPDPNFVQITPNSLSFIAGMYASLNIELRAANGRLYRDLANKGWYDDNTLTKAFTLKIEDLVIESVSIIKGKQYGTYSISFTSKQANYLLQNLSIAYQDPNNTNSSFINILQNIPTRVYPNSFSYLVSNDTTQTQRANCRASNNKLMTFYSYDKYDNKIEEVIAQSLGFKLKNTNPLDTINPTVSFTSNGFISLTFLCKKAGTVTLTSSSFKNEPAGIVLTSFKFDIIPGNPNPLHSLAYLSKTVINAGEIVSWIISPSDIYDNPIVITDNQTANALNLFNATENYQGTSLFLSDSPIAAADGSTLRWNVNLTKAGGHSFKAFYNNLPISSSSDQLKVMALTPWFSKTLLAKLNPQTNLYEEYDGLAFVQDIKEFPQLKVNYYDIFNNSVDPAAWNLKIYLNSELQNITYLERIEFCTENTPLYSICANNSIDQASILDKTPKSRYTVLVANLQYIVTLRNNADQFQIQQYNFNITGTNTNDETKNLPVDPSNTIITPITTLQTVAGESTTFTIELRTTLPNYRRNEWYSKPMEALKLKFKYNQTTIYYNIVPGDITDRYFVTIKANETHPIDDSNLITLLIEGVTFTKYQPKWVVGPAEIVSIAPVLIKNTVISVISNIPQNQTVDDLYIANFQAKDKYSNPIMLKEGGVIINVILQGNKTGNLTFTKEFLSNGILKVSFQPIFSQEVNISFGSDINNSYITFVKQGVINIDNSYANIKYNSEDIVSSITAGSIIQIHVYPRDKWGNQLNLDETILNESYIKYYYNRPGVTGYIVGESQAQISDTLQSLTFDSNVTFKGNYLYKVSIRDQEIRIILGLVNVIPAKAYLVNSLLKYLDDEASQYIPMMKNLSLKEDNNKDYPSYLLTLADIYGNLYDEFQENITEFSVILTGNLISLNPLNYDSNQIVGNSLYITISNASLQGYRDGIYNNTPYSFQITWNRDSHIEIVTYPITLLGAGEENDKDAEINTDEDLSKTWLSKTSLNFLAGGVDTYLLEIRTADGKRKADFHKSISFNFLINATNNLTNGNFSASIQNATLRGRFLVTVYGELANNYKSPYILAMNVVLNPIPQTLSLTVTANALEHITIPSDLSIEGDADYDYVFDIIPFDKFLNIAEVTESDINLRIIFPTSNTSVPSSYSTVKDPSTGSIKYIVKSRIAGTYLIQSSLLIGNQTREFLVLPGAASILTSQAMVTPDIGFITAGENLTINLIAKDAYYNKIVAGKSSEINKKLLSLFTLGLAEGSYKTNVPLIVDTPNGNLQANLVYNKTGIITLTPELSNSAIQCVGCIINVGPSDLDIKQTKFFALNMGESTINETRVIKTPYGSNNVIFSGKLYDKFGNLMQGLPDNASFVLTMDGNDMDILTFNLSSDGINNLAFSVKSIDNVTFSRLVPRSNYTLSLTYTLPNYQNLVNITMEIVGNDDGSGNGPFVANLVLLDPQSIRIAAGHKGYITITLRQKSGLRFNGYFDINLFKANEINIVAEGVNLNPLNYKFYNGDKSGIFFLEITGTQAFNGTDKKNLYLTIDSQNIRNPIVEVIIIPDYPLADNTVIISPSAGTISSDVNANKRVDIIFQLFDKYNNLFARSDLASKLYPKIANDGAASFNATYLNDTTTQYPQVDGSIISIQNNSYIISMYPKYPPRILKVMVFYAADNYTSYPISVWPFTYSIHTVIQPSNTAIVGSNVTGVSIGEALNFSILVKDTEGYCFEEPEGVSYQITGPYLNEDLNDMTLTYPTVDFFERNYTTNPHTVTDEEANALNSSGYICKRYYQGYIPGNEIQKVGYYQIAVFILGENKGLSVLTIRKTYMSPGAINPRNSILTIPTLYNKGSNPLELLANTPLNILVILRDDYKNVLNKNISIGASQYFTFQIAGLVENIDYQKNITLLTNATFRIDLIIKKTGLIGAISASLLGQNFTFSSLDRIDYPSTIEILAGACSGSNPQVDYIDKAVAGIKQFLTIQCRDEYNNTVFRGGAIFKLKITGFVETVGIDIVNANIKDSNTGIYNVDFTFTWAGDYSVIIYLDNIQYTQVFTIKVINSICAQDKPYYCLSGTSAGQCGLTYRDCGYDFLNACPSDETPISCKVDGKVQCVAASYQCDCHEDYIKCPSDQKCVDAFLSSDLCAVQADTANCQGEFPTLCPDNSCRSKASECPSQVGCPPGTKMCADQTCIDSNKICSNFAACDFGFKCEDQSCVNNLNDCPTRITCTNVDWIICPDKTCAQNELDCKLPIECSTDNEGNQLVLCSDQSCRKTQKDCPSPVTCPLNYALCEDGSCRKECTGTIQSRRILNFKSSGSKLYRLLANLNEESSNSTSKCNKISCPGGECVDNAIKCPSAEACPLGYVKCSDLSCASSQKQCIVQVCPINKYHCWDGNCVDSVEECATRISCPSDSPVKCPDGSCSNSLESCAEFIACPAYLPYRCGNGECRGKSSECPTMITCPIIKPFLCSDNTCQTNKDACNSSVINMKCSSNKVRCSDGSCAYAKYLCPTIQSCNLGQVRCWDSSCADTLSSCPPIGIDSQVCPGTSLRCPDGSCRMDLSNCPSQMICPLDRPVKCDDGTCKQSNSLCAINTQCPAGMTRCPDGSCTKSRKCGSPITCSEQAPFLCYDNTCKIDPRDCPSTPICSDLAPILCPDGTCVSQRSYCQGFDACDEGNEVRCPDLFCYPSRKNCTMFSGCPGSRVLCDDGSCATTSLDCPNMKCPVQSPYKCQDGFCVSNLMYCDNNVTGCPYNKPFKCLDGACSLQESLCPNNNTAICPTNSDVLCPDGSCARSIERCPNALGCSEDTPFKCGNDLCINPNKTSCSVLNCPSNRPIKCKNGFCAKSITYCNSFISLEDYAQCSDEVNGNNVPCANGRCVASATLCKPLIPCDSNSVRCKDNSCRPIQDLCPLTTTECPNSKPYRCDGGSCAKDSLSCPTVNGCPNNFPWKCEITGTCVKENADCEGIYKKTILMNNCTVDLPYRCSDGICSLNSSNCTTVKACPDSKLPYQCIDSSCVSNKTLCPKQSDCKGFLCPDFKCVTEFSQCLTKNGCPASKPFKCVDGRCVSSPFSLYGNISHNCIPMVVCPKYKPYLCGDGECQGHQSLCRTQQNCPEEKSYRCPDQTCVNSTDLCDKQPKLCPQTSPIMCEDGGCVTQALECQTSNNLFCSEENPFPCASGECVKYPAQCVSEEIRSGKAISSRFLISNNSVVTFNTSIDPGCTSETPNRCYDGTCRNNFLDCPLSNGCRDMDTPYKCLSGLCAATAKQCQTVDSTLTCSNNLTLCEDGYCRNKCPEYNGCPNISPLLCPNGFCARSLSECAGDSACPLLTKPYRCVDNTCVSDRTRCTVPKRNYLSETVHITISPVSTTNIDFIQAGANSQIRYGQLIIPAGAILPQMDNSTSSNNDTNTSSSTKLFAFVLSPIAQSTVKKATNPVDSSKKSYTNEIFPFSDGELEYHQSIRSPLVQIQTLDRPSTPYRFPIVLYLSTDFLENSTITDYCLGKLNTVLGAWDCHSRILVSQEYTSDKLGYPVNEDGVYSVIFNPTPIQAVVEGEPCGFFCEYKMILLYVFIGLIVFSVVFTYLIWRVSRYVTKYRQAKKQMDNYREQIGELEQAQTDVQGQTIKDKIEGISFTKNLAFKEENSGIFFIFYRILYILGVFR